MQQVVGTLHGQNETWDLRCHGMQSLHFVTHCILYQGLKVVLMQRHVMQVKGFAPE